MKTKGVKKRTAVRKTLIKRAAVKKKLAEMNLLDDFLFGSVVAYPEIGESFVRILLRIVFGREFGRLSVTAQKVLYGEDTDLRGARLDVCLELEEDAEGRATVYDVEPDRNDNKKDIKALSRRVRFYHGKLIARELNAGAEFNELKNVVILMIVPYDPFGLNRMICTIENGCKEVPEMPYEDGASTMFLYTKGTVGVPNEEVKQLLQYMEETTYENAVNEDLRAMNEMIETVRKDPATSLAYWKMVHKQIRSQKEAEARGQARGEAIGQAIGEAIGEARGQVKGEAIGQARGEAMGDTRRLISQICRKMIKKKTLNEIVEEVEEEISIVEPIYNAAKEFAPDYDVNKILQMINK